MEQFERKPIVEQSPVLHKEVSRIHPDAPSHRTFKQNGETYEEDVLLYEPKERYQDDLQRLNVVIARKKEGLRDIEEKLKAHESASSSPMHLLQDDIARKAAYTKKEIERLEITRMITLQRLGLLAVQDSHEKGLLDNLSTDVEN